jgi:hypothetical protein
MLGRRFRRWSRFVAVSCAVLLGTPFWMFPFHSVDSLAAVHLSKPAPRPSTTAMSAPGGENGSLWPGLKPTAPHSFSAMVQSSSPSYDHCVQDDTDSLKILAFSSTTGAFSYSQGGQVLFSGTGTASNVNGCVDFSGKSGQNSAKATYGSGCTSATATITWNYATGLYSTFTLTDSNTAANTCGASPSVGPSISLLAPVGGEILDAGTTLNIIWSTYDPQSQLTGVTIELSTNGGSTFSTLATMSAAVIALEGPTYAWTVPSITNTADVLVKLVGSCQCDGESPTAESGDFMIWNPGVSLPNVAEAPIFFSSQGFNSTIYLTNTSNSTATVELDPHLPPSSNATQNFPAQLSLAAGASATVNPASLFTIGASPENVNFPDALTAAIRMRTNATPSNAVVASIVGDMANTQKYSTAFTYAAVSQSTTGTMQCAPMYYVDSASDALVSLQNTTNAPQTVELSCNYGAGSYGANGQANTSISLGPQQTYVAHMSAIISQFDGANWGSMNIVTSAPQSVVAQAVMVSAVNGTAWDCPFLDPAMAVGTTKVANSVMLDYNNNENAQIMVCNMSSSSRTVNVTFPTSNGISLPSTQVTVAPYAQQMITLNSQLCCHPGRPLLRQPWRPTLDLRPTLPYRAARCPLTSAGRCRSNLSSRAPLTSKC